MPALPGTAKQRSNAEMATKKKMGFDPLAWMNEDDEKAAPPRVVKAPAKKKRASRKKKDGGLDIDLLESTFEALAPRGEELVARFYEELFSRYPAVIPMFSNADPAKQQQKLLAALALVVKNLRKPEVLKKALGTLGEKHQAYGAEPAHYEAVATTLLDVMKEMAGDLWTDEVARA